MFNSSMSDSKSDRIGATPVEPANFATMMKWISLRSTKPPLEVRIFLVAPNKKGLSYTWCVQGTENP